MLQNEFMEKCGLGEKIAAKEYPIANLVYMSMPDSMCRDNNQFCELYKEARKCAPAKTIIEGLAEELRNLNRQVASVKAEMKTIEDGAIRVNLQAEQQRDEMERKHRAEITELANWIIQQADRNTDDYQTRDMMRDKARALFGNDGEYYAAILLYGCPDEKDMQEAAKRLRNA